MIDITVIDKAVKLKKELEAAYIVFKKTPTVENSAAWITATRIYNDFCISTITALVEERIGQVNQREDIVTNFDKYKECNQCGAGLLFPTTGDNYIASSDFVEDFAGWCYPCLVQHCTTHECEGCTVAKNPETCPFKEVKKLHVPGEA